jgi:magnesium transporter
VIIDCATYVDGVRQPGPPTLAVLKPASPGLSSFTWLGLRMPDDAELRDVADAFEWPDFPADEVLAPHARPVLTVDADTVRLVLRTARYDDRQEQVSLGELTLVVNSTVVVSIRYGLASPLSQLRQELERAPDRLAPGPFAVLAAIVSRVIDDYGPALDGFENDVIEVEHDVFSDNRRQPVRRIYQLKRQVRELLVAIESLPDPLARLLRSCATRIPAEVLPDLYVASEQLERAIRRARSLSDLIDAALDAALAQISVHQNNDMRKISAWVAIAAGPTMIAGVYGMNFEHLPELRWRLGYPMVLTVMVGLMVGLFRGFRRSGWL